jgi:DMSO/TMAO reductase YedYZ molybdopterin-dependent catalytic subunit
VLIAYQMNGRELSLDHGYPVRAVVPGHYGMASVKWLTRICAVREPFQGYWQTSDYAYWDYLAVRTASSASLNIAAPPFSVGTFFRSGIRWSEIKSSSSIQLIGTLFRLA